jgi:ABC-type transport system involved in multi-copper enzyme maturation permease subunit
MPKLLVGILILALALLFLLSWVSLEAGGANLSEAQRQDIEATLRPENAIPVGTGQTRLVATVLVIVLAGSSMGGEYGAGTVRTMVLRTRARWQFVAAKLVNVTAFALGLSVVGLLVSAAICVALAPEVGGDRSAVVTTEFVTDAIPAVLRTTWTMVPYIAIAVFLGVLGRSSAMAIGVPLGIVIVEVAVTTGLQAAGGWLEDVTQALPSVNVAALMEANGQVQGAATEAPSDLPNAWQAAAVLGAYALAAAVLALSIFQRRDITAE